VDKEVGNKDFGIWLLDDSNPERSENALTVPFDLRYPVRHNIWTPMFDAIQDRVFRQHRLRLNTSSLFIRNAIENPRHRPTGAAVKWSAEVEAEMRGFQRDIRVHHPPPLLCFGTFAFEFVRRAPDVDADPPRRFGYWTTEQLPVALGASRILIFASHSPLPPECIKAR